MSSKSKASCSASMVAATTGREVSGPSKTSSTSSPSDITTPASASSRAIRSRSSSVNCSRTSCRVPPSCMTIWAASSRSGEPKSISGSSSTSSDRVASATVLSGAYPCSRSAASRASPLSMPFRRLRSYESAMSAIASGPAPRRMSWATSNLFGYELRRGNRSGLHTGRRRVLRAFRLRRVRSRRRIRG